MSIDFKRDEIVSATEFSKNFAEYSKKIKEVKRLVIFKNNKPSVVALDIDHYEKLVTCVELLENAYILKLVEDREKNDDGTRYSTQDVLELVNKLKSCKGE